MLITFNTYIFLVQTAHIPYPPKLYVGFKGTHDTYFCDSAVSFDWANTDDLQELDLLRHITGIVGEVQWDSDLKGKRVRVIAEVARKNRTEIQVIPKAIGQKKEKNGDDDHFIVLNSKRELVTEEKAMEIITNELQ